MNPISNELVAFRLTNQMKDRLRQFAEDEMLSVSDVCRRSLFKTLQENELMADPNRPSQWSVNKR